MDVMLKNREVLAVYSFIIFIVIGSAVVCYKMPSYGIIIILADGVLFAAAFYFFCSYRYRRIRRISEFLRRAQHEMLPLEAYDQQEGELSVLKSEIYKLLTKLHVQADLLERDKRYLADVIADISHQLKTPMTSMNVMTEHLKDETLPREKRLEFTRCIHSQLARMEWLLSAMLTMSKVDAGVIRLKREPVRMAELAASASEHLVIPMELHGQTLVCDVEASMMYHGDFYWSSEAVSNILKNCVEHTPDGGTIRIWADNNPVYASLRIRDEGGGISEADRPHIFERFYKGSNASADSVGIGLALAKQLITAQNGTLDIESTDENSTTFLIKFYHANI